MSVNININDENTIKNNLNNNNINNIAPSIKKLDNKSN